jgi:hypothetical protein
MRIGAIAFVGLTIAGCGLATSYQIANMTPDELAKLSDDDICRPWTGSNPAVAAERKRRDLGDCDPEHLYCKNMGYQKGTELYLRCRQLAAQQQAAAQAQRQHAISQASETWQKAYQQPTVTNTNCSTYGNTLNCTSRTQP